jgi:hypothetical protein
MRTAGVRVRKLVRSCVRALVGIGASRDQRTSAPAHELSIPRPSPQNEQEVIKK